MGDNNQTTNMTDNRIFKLSVTEKLIIRYAVFYILFFVIGLICFYLVKLPQTDGLIKYINVYFSCTFSFDKGINENTALLLAISFADIKTMVYLFVAGFTMFSSMAIYWLLCTQALSLGFSSLYLVNTMAYGVLDGVSFFDLVLFLLSSAAISSLMILYSAKTRIFNESFRKIIQNKKQIIKHKPLYLQIYLLLTLCGGIISINIIRFLFNIL